MALQRKITFWMLLLLTVNAIIGTGIYFTPSIAASIAGHSSIYSWIIAIGISILMALIFSELSAVYPKTGGIYEYSKQSFGEFAGFVTGWTAWIVSNVAIAMLLIGGVEYLSMVIPMAGFVKIGLALALVAIINYISFRGIDVSAKILVVFAIISVSSLLFVIATGILSFEPANLSNFSLVVPGVTVLIGVFFVIETFFGWESITFLSEETKNPKKNIPRALLIGTVIVSILSFVAVFLALNNVPIHEFSESGAALVLMVSRVLSPELTTFVIMLIVFNIIGGGAAWMVTTPRLIYAMARDKMLPYTFAEIHPKTKTPHKAIMLQAVITSFVLLTGSYVLLLKVILPLAILMYAIPILSVTKISKKVHSKIRYRLPFHKIIPYFIVAILVAMLILSSNVSEVIMGVAFLLLGLPLYVIASMGYNETLTKIIHGATAWIIYRTYKQVISKNIIEHMLNFLTDITVENIVDLGCGVGVITNKIAKSVVTSEGRVYGIDYSRHSIKIAKSIAERQDIKNVEFHCENFYNISKNNTLNNKLKKIDAFVGVGVLGYINRLDIILDEMRKRSRENAKFYFVDYDYPGHFLDRPWIENNKEILKTFEKAGFRAKIWRQKKFLITFVHIYGEKI